MGVGLLIKIDSSYLGLFARILLEVDFTKPLTRRILVTKKDLNICNEIEFFEKIDFENLPKFCEQCIIIGHDVSVTEVEQVCIVVKIIKGSGTKVTTLNR